jgi:hypothetical protein
MERRPSSLAWAGQLRVGGPQVQRGSFWMTEWQYQYSQVRAILAQRADLLGWTCPGRLSCLSNMSSINDPSGNAPRYCQRDATPLAAHDAKPRPARQRGRSRPNHWYSISNLELRGWNPSGISGENDVLCHSPVGPVRRLSWRTTGTLDLAWTALWRVKFGNTTKCSSTVTMDRDGVAPARRMTRRTTCATC